MDLPSGTIEVFSDSTDDRLVDNSSHHVSLYCDGFGRFIQTIEAIDPEMDDCFAAAN